MIIKKEGGKERLVLLLNNLKIRWKEVGKRPKKNLVKMIKLILKVKGLVRKINKRDFQML